jgi:hypothetical protein
MALDGRMLHERMNWEGFVRKMSLPTRETALVEIRTEYVQIQVHGVQDQWYCPLGTVEVGPSQRLVHLFTIEVTSDQTSGNWYHFINLIRRITVASTVS